MNSWLEVIVNWFRLKACVKCGGDLALDEGDWLCLQCGTYYYMGLYQDWQLMELVERPPLRSNHRRAKTIGFGLTGPPVYRRSGTLEPATQRIGDWSNPGDSSSSANAFPRCFFVN